MEKQLTDFFSQYCKDNNLNLEVKEVKFSKKTFWSVKISEPSTKKSLSAGFFPDHSEEQNQRKCEWFMEDAKILFLK